MNQKIGMKELGKELFKGLPAFFFCAVGSNTYYPLLPAYFAVCSRNGQASVCVILMICLGMFQFMSPDAVLKYVFTLVVIGLGIKLYIWANRFCGKWEVAAFAGVSVLAMDYAGNTWNFENGLFWVTGFLEGMMVFGMTLLMHTLAGLPFKWNYHLRLGQAKELPLSRFSQEPHMQRMESFASAVNGLSDAFFLMSQPRERKATEQVSVLEQEITGNLCASCTDCAICWNENRMRRQGGIRALLHAVVNHSTKEQLLSEPYLNDCRQYEGMVEEALQAFGRLELNHAWHNRLCENRYVIAQQLDAMAGFMEEWAKEKVNIDEQSRGIMANISYEVKEKGLLIEDLHIYEDEGRLSVEGWISSKWNGGIPSRYFLEAVEKAVKRPMRFGKDAKTILTQDAIRMRVYEDTRFYGLQGIALERKNGSLISGDSYSFFAMDDGSYHVCISDGMGSGSQANQESEMVVDLLQKFIEAGFRKETAIKLMNSAMVLQGEENSFSTLDYAMINLYTGELELIKIGGAATFIKRKNVVECVEIENLPAGADVRIEVESTKKQLQDGDFLVMVTDGVIEYLQVRNPKETIQDIIAGANTDNAGMLAETILNQVLLRTGGVAADDMTVLVTGIWEK